MDYDTMKAGLEMDTLVAEKVMGLIPQKDFGVWDEHVWKLYENHTGPACNRCYYSYCKHCPAPKDHGKCEVRPKNYSTDISIAWDIMDHLIDLHPAIMWENCEWECCLDDHNKGHGEQFWGYADTAPLAICRAVLKTVEGI